MVVCSLGRKAAVADFDATLGSCFSKATAFTGFDPIVSVDQMLQNLDAGDKNDESDQHCQGVEGDLGEMVAPR